MLAMHVVTGRFAHAFPRSVAIRATTRRSRGIVCLASSKAKVVFLGTPEVAADSLESLLTAANADNSIFEVAAVVSQPGKPKGRGRVKGEATPSPVAARAAQCGLPVDQILTPAKAREEDFLLKMEDIAPDLCITAAYGNMLPQRFLNIPKYGTLNIHPSLLPKFRGAAPVQRALEAGVEETGVSVAYTVLACDAGPVLASESVPTGDHLQHPEMLAELFKRGTALLLAEMPGALDGSGMSKAVPQDESQVVHADKVAKEDGVLSFSQPALTLHNRVRGFAGWPGTMASFLVTNKKGEEDLVSMKVVRTRVGKGERATGLSPDDVAIVDKLALQVQCEDGSLLEILELQPPGKKVQAAAAFWNGLQGRRVRRA